MKRIILTSLILTGCGAEPEAAQDDVVSVPVAKDAFAASETEEPSAIPSATPAATEEVEQGVDGPEATATAAPTVEPTPDPTPSPTPEPVDLSVWVDEQSGLFPEYMKKWKYGGIGWKDQGAELCGDWYHAGSFVLREAIGHGLFDYFQPAAEPARAWASDWQWHTTGERRGEEVLIAEGIWSFDVPLHIFCWKELQ